MVPCEVAKSLVGALADTDPVSNIGIFLKATAQHYVSPKRDAMDRFPQCGAYLMPNSRESLWARRVG